jgi:hypothetical protein
MVIRATTTESGRMSLLGDTSDTLRMEPPGVRKEVDWRRPVNMNKDGRLGDLIGGRFDLIAHVLINRGVPPTAPVRYGHSGTLRKVQCDGIIIVSTTIEWREL